jgi:hypothetical protein
MSEMEIDLGLRRARPRQRPRSTGPRGPSTPSRARARAGPAGSLQPPGFYGGSGLTGAILMPPLGVRLSGDARCWPGLSRQHKANTSSGPGRRSTREQHGQSGILRHTAARLLRSPCKPLTSLYAGAARWKAPQGPTLPGDHRPSVNRQVIGSSPIAGATCREISHPSAGEFMPLPASCAPEVGRRMSLRSRMPGISAPARWPG